MTDYDFLTDPSLPRISSISASQAFRETSSLSATPYPASAAAVPLPTGLDGLDDALSKPAPSAAATDCAAGSAPGGIPRGSITEIYGPPGVGKTAFSLNIAAKTLAAGENERIVWIDTGSPIPTPRLKQILASKLAATSTNSETPLEDRLENCLSRFQYLRAPSLPHLLSLFAHPSPPNFPAPNTTLIIIDSISAPFQSYFPNATELKARLQSSPNKPGQVPTEQAQKLATQWLLNRKWNVTADLANRMIKLATPNPSSGAKAIAIVILNQTHTKIRGQPRPTLYPAVSGGASWENCIHTRIVLYRDWAPIPSSSAADQAPEEEEDRKVVYAEITKRAGKLVPTPNSRTDGVDADGNGVVFPFVIRDDGIRELLTPPLPPSTPLQLQGSSPMTIRKRKVDEIADSEDDDGSISGDDDEEEGYEDEFTFDDDNVDTEQKQDIPNLDGTKE